jgi:hypothetical protein
LNASARATSRRDPPPLLNNLSPAARGGLIRVTEENANESSRPGPDSLVRRGGCDGAQSCFHMALFKRPGGTYVVGLTTSREMMQQSYFLEYSGGARRDVGARVVPEYGEDKVYELPRYGTTVEVFENRLVEGEGWRERGRKLYELAWENGRFVRRRGAR